LGEGVVAELAQAGVALTAVRRLAVDRVPHSGKAEELMDAFGISARKIVEAVGSVLEKK
jgi:transketolase